MRTSTVWRHPGASALSTLLALVIAVLSCAKRNHSPEVPVAPSGPASGRTGIDCQFWASAVDCDKDDKVSVRFDWGDGDTSNWSGFFHSGDSASKAHAYASAGTFLVRAQARDLARALSDWSSTCSVAVLLDSNLPPYTPATPSGPDRGQVNSNYAFSSSASDPENDSVSIRFDWGDGQVSAWSSPVAGGATVTMDHAWSATGSYAVKAQAKDRGGRLSGWSGARVIAVAYRQLETPVVTCQAIGNGGSLRLAWPAVTGAEGYRVEADGVVNTIVGTTYDVTAPARALSVWAYSGSDESGAWTMDATPVTTAVLEVWGISDTTPDHPAAFGFDVAGTITAYLVRPANYPAMDFYLEDVQMPGMNIVNPGDRGWNYKGNATAQSGLTDFDAATLASAPGMGHYYTQRELVVNSVYYFWLDRTNDGWDVTDNFAKAKVVSIQGTKVTMRVAFQKVGGLRWLKTN